MQMPFGKHAGEEIANVPRPYLSWALENMDDMKPELRAAIESTLRDTAPPPAKEPSRTKPRNTTAGGDPLVEAITRLTEAVDRLTDEIKINNFYPSK